jgi:hypothetical protein
MVGIKYVGKKEKHTDHLYGTGLAWVLDQVHNVSDAVADKMAVHTDIYFLCKPAEGAPEAEVTDHAPPEQEELQPILPHLDGMGKDELVTYAQQHFGENMSKSMKVENMRARVLNLIQARGF